MNTDNNFSHTGAVAISADTDIAAAYSEVIVKYQQVARRGDAEYIAAQTGIPARSVYAFLNGERPMSMHREKIVAALPDIIEERLQEKQRAAVALQRIAAM